jgi:glutaminyl-peptide cyclotransferase
VIMQKSLFLILLPALFACGENHTVLHATPTIIRTIPHDPHAFTQGLLFHDGYLYESTGLYGQSSLRRVDPANGNVLKNLPVTDVFAEGLALVDSTLVQLTWKEKAALRYSLSDFKITGAFSYDGEGWGLTFDGRSFIMSNGSDTLFRRSSSFALQKKIPVTVAGRPLMNLNELEFANGKIYANVWYNNYIFEIMPLTGKVSKIIDCTSIVKKAQTQSDDEVLNGIAYDPKTGTFYITGKNWQYMFEVRW